jgi:hypothetical protein
MSAKASVHILDPWAAILEELLLMPFHFLEDGL